MSTHLTRFGGHAGAAGFEFRHDQFEAIVAGMTKFFNDQESQPMKATVFYDLDVTTDQLDASLMKWLESLGPFGQGFPPPLFRLNHARIKDSKVLRGGHRKIWLENSSGPAIEALYFSPPSHLRDEQLQKGGQVDLLVELQWNDFGGQRTLQLLIRDLQSSGIEKTIERGVHL